MILQSIKIKNVTIDIISGPVGINCSGGADSSLLLYILASYHKEPIHVFTFSDSIKGYSNIDILLNVIDFIKQKTGHLEIYHYIHCGTGQNLDKLAVLPRKFLRDNSVSVIYDGLTCNPPAKVMESANTPENRDPTIIKNLWDDDGNVYMPFRNSDKSVIKELYDELMLTDTLFSLTRSCELETPVKVSYHCGKCWWCRERMWAFNKL
jgi:7-cyano-7-deazaguanine synthase in queuosine biosynthesis